MHRFSVLGLLVFTGMRALSVLLWAGKDYCRSARREENTNFLGRQDHMPCRQGDIWTSNLRLVTLAPSSAVAFPAQGQPFCPSEVVAKGLIFHNSNWTMMARKKTNSSDFLEAQFYSKMCPSPSFKMLNKVKFSCYRREWVSWRHPCMELLTCF